MVDLNISDTLATNSSGGCGCGCSGHGATTDTPADAETTPTGNATTAVYTVSGMTCDHCVQAVTEEVLTLSGVSAVQVDLESGRLAVTAEGPVDFDRIVEAVAEAGDYTVS